MATVTRQPFAPLDGARLQTLTSLKNRQNALSNSPSKRKASEVDVDDFENLDPVLFSKRSKGTDTFSTPSSDFFKPSSFILTKSVSTPTIPKDAFTSPTKPASTSSRPRSFLQPKSPAARIKTKFSSSTPLTAPAGRSPTRGPKRIGILSRRRTGRVEPPSFGLASAAPFSLDAALKGTIPSYGSNASLSSSKTSSSSLSSTSIFGTGADMSSSSWFFDIHEDTPEQEMTNLLQHSTCTLDISSDEESEQRIRRETAEGRDKENIPPVDDVSQTTSASRRVRTSEDDMIVDKARGPLVEMNAADYYADGCDEASVVVVPGDDEEEQETLEARAALSLDGVAKSAPLPLGDIKVAVEQVEHTSIDEVMGKDDAAAKAAVLQPIEGTGESFELWESGSAKDGTSVPASPGPEVGAAVC